jgi:hypothetical protein
MSTSLQLAEAQVALLTAEAAADDAEAAVASVQAVIAERLRRARNAEVRKSAAQRRRASAAAPVTTSASRKTDPTNSEGAGSSAGADAGGCNTGIDSAASGGGGGTAAAVAELETKVREMHGRVSETDARLSRLCDEAEEMDAMCASLEGEIAVARAAVEQNRKSQRGSPATVKGSGLRRAQSLADEMSAHSASPSSQVNTRGERFVAVEGVVPSESESDSRVGVDGHQDAVQLRAEIQDLARELGCDVASVPRRQEDVENT